MPTWLIWVIVIIVVLVVAALIVSLTRKRQTHQHRARAEELRQEASGQAAGLPESHRHAEELRAQADLARAEAQRAEERAATAEQSHQVEQAGYEDTVREADRLDPDVDHRADDYEPNVQVEPAPTTEATPHTAEETPSRPPATETRPPATD